MPTEYGWDLKWRVVWQNVVYGWEPKEIAVSLFVAVSFVYDCLHLYNEYGAPYRTRRAPGPCKSYTDEDLLVLDSWLDENCDMYGDELVAKMSRELEFDTSPSTVCRMIAELGHTHKKV